jgi:hypothetical protein
MPAPAQARKGGKIFPDGEYQGQSRTLRCGSVSRSLTGANDAPGGKSSYTSKVSAAAGDGAEPRWQQCD